MAGSGGGKCKVADRNKIFCKGYRDRNTREKNKVVRIKRHLKRQPSDVAALAHIERLQNIIRGYKIATG